MRHQVLTLITLEASLRSVVHQSSPVINSDSVGSIVSQLRIFGGVTDAQRETIFRRMEVWTLRAGEVVFRKGDEPLHIYVVKSGKIDLQITEDDVVIHKHELHVGECFGESSLLSMHKHTATATAAADSEVMVLSRKALLDLKHEDTELFALLILNLARELARRLYITDQMLLDATARRTSAP
ncbi:MAG TPA: cyclic nucleotide-binding domain-containing protein [Chthoniobacteraceae bacterium]|nr:cyclic nucleotide-binding domain-containing protein [Chthoniobacteraceae bacterium]